MHIKKYPDIKQVSLKEIGRGNCFMTINDDEDRHSPHDYEWEGNEIFIVCENSGQGASNVIPVVHLETGTLDAFSADLIVEKVKAHIVCE